LVFPYKPLAGTGPNSHLDLEEVRSLGIYHQVSQTLDENQQDEVDKDQHQMCQHLPTHPIDPSNLTSNNSYAKMWTDYDHRIAAAKIAPVWFISNFAYNTSLRYTSITSSTILVNTGSLFTFLFALLTKDEHFHIYKFLGILCGMSGCILTGMHDASTSSATDDDGHHTRIRILLRLVIGDRVLSLQEQNEGNTNDDNPVWGDILSLLSAVFYGVYAVMVRVLCPHDESLMSMKRFLGYIGLYNMLALSPFVIWQVGSNSSTLSVFVIVCLIGKGLFDNVLSDYLWARAVVLTSATVATVGLGLTIPLAFLSDIAMGRHDVLNVESLVGALAVLMGFVLVNIGQQKDNEDNAEAHHTAMPIQFYQHSAEESSNDVMREQQQTTSTEGSLSNQWRDFHHPTDLHQQQMNVELQTETRYTHSTMQ
jgi:solute carrier family 35, member F5